MHLPDIEVSYNDELYNKALINPWEELIYTLIDFQRRQEEMGMT